MSNVHRLGDYSNLPQSNDNAGPSWGPPPDALDKIPFFGMRQGGSGNPKKENFCQMLYLAFCPKLKLFSFTTAVVLTCLIMFIITLSVWGVYTSPGANLLTPKSDGMLKMGAMNQVKLFSGQVQRLVAAIFLHWSFIHIFFNMVAILSCMSMLEKSYGILPTMGIFFLGGIGGNIFSACVNSWNPNTIYAGASTAIFAIIGAWIAFIIQNWQGLGNVVGKEARCMMTCMVAMNCFIVWMLSSMGQYGSDSTQTDSYGHLGGFITGIIVGLWLPQPMEKSTWTQGCKLTGFALTGTFFLLTFVLFWTTNIDNYDNHKGILT